MGTPPAPPGMPGLPTNTDTGAGMEQQLQRMATLKNAPQDTMPSRQAAQQFAQAHPEFNPLQVPFEWAGGKIYEIYSKYVSRPVTTALIMPQILDAENKGAFSDGGLFSSEAWDRAYRDAHYVSPGQALYKTFGTMFDSQSGEMQSLQFNKADGTILWDHPDQVQSFFSHGAQKYLSGGIDAGFSWEADPFALVGKGSVIGKGLAKAREGAEGVTGLDLTIRKPGVQIANQTLPGAITSGALGLAGKIRGVDPGKIAEAQSIWDARRFDTSAVAKNLAGEGVKGSTFTVMGDQLEKAQKAQGDGYAAWVMQQPQFKHGGSALGSALSQAKDRQDINDILATVMGDTERPASAGNRAEMLKNKGLLPNVQDPRKIGSLGHLNAELGAQLQNLQQETNGIYAQIKNPLYADPITQFNLQLRQSQIAHQMQSIQDQVGFLSKVAGNYDFNKAGELTYQGGGLTPSLRGGFNFNQHLTPAMNRAKELAGTFDYKQVRGAGKFAGMANLVYNNTVVRPMRIFESWNDIMPNGWIKPDDPNSHLELDAQLRQSGVYTPAERNAKVSEYINSAGAGRINIVKDAEQDMLSRMGAKYGISDLAAKKLYMSFSEARGAAMNRVFSAAKLTDANGKDYHIDQLTDSAGNVTGYGPVLSSQLANSHPMMDIQYLNRVLKLNARGLNALLSGGMGLDEAAKAVSSGARVGNVLTRTLNGGKEFADLANALWKTNVLLRMGYGIRAVSDDFLGQIARFGATNMALRPANFAGTVASKINGWMHDPLGWDQRLIKANTDIESTQQILDLEKNARAKTAAKQYVSPRWQNIQTQKLADHDQKIAGYQSDLDLLNANRAALNNLKSRMVDHQIVLPSGKVIPAFAEGPQGAIALNNNAGARTAFNAGVGTAASTILSHLRGAGWSTIRSGDAGFRNAWYRSVQMEIANDPLAKQFAGGASIRDALSWMQKPEGRRYWDDLGLKYAQKSDLAESVKAHVDSYLPVSDANSAALRQAIADGKGDKEVLGLLDKVPQEHRPLEVHGEQASYAMGRSTANQAIDKNIGRFYKWMSEVPTQVLSRNPLAAELYHGHVMTAYDRLKEQGVTSISQAQIQKIASDSRKLAVEDVKRFTYNMDHETKMSYMMRFMMPFFGPMQEPIMRWGRLIGERPSIGSRFEMLYNAPNRGGVEVDSSGNPIDGTGHATDEFGNKYAVADGDRYFQAPIPQWMANSMGLKRGGIIDASGNKHDAPYTFQFKMSSLPLPFRNDPWYNPGEGPFIQIAMNHFASDSPSLADSLQKLGVLPYGLQKSDLSFIGGQAENLAGASDPLQDARMQYQIWNGLNYEYMNGLRKTAPTWSEVQDRASHEKMLNNIMSTNWNVLMPVNVKIRDNYQFFTDAYKNLVAANPATARQLFYQKYGPSAYGFTQSLLKDRYTGIPTTAKALVDSERYKDLLDKYPDMAGVLLGSDQTGNYSQATNQILQMQGERQAMTPQEAWAENQKSLGWQIYGQVMNQLTSTLKTRGLHAITDRGAEDLKQMKDNMVRAMASPTGPDGKPNPLQNQDWANAYYEKNPYKNDDKAAELTQMIQDPGIQKLINQQDSPRRDLQGLATYLSYRAQAVAGMMANQTTKTSIPMDPSQIKTTDAALQVALMQRYAAPLDINKKQNAGIKQAFQDAVLQLIESNTDFHSLHDRYLATDMFDHYDGTSLVNTVYGGS